MTWKNVDLNEVKYEHLADILKLIFDRLNVELQVFEWHDGRPEYRLSPRQRPDDFETD